jgi:hypothetical protein
MVMMRSIGGGTCRGLAILFVYLSDCLALWHAAVQTRPNWQVFSRTDKLKMGERFHLHSFFDNASPVLEWACTHPWLPDSALLLRYACQEDLHTRLWSNGLQCDGPNLLGGDSLGRRSYCSNMIASRSLHCTLPLPFCRIKFLRGYTALSTSGHLWIKGRDAGNSHAVGAWGVSYEIFWGHSSHKQVQNLAPLK